MENYTSLKAMKVSALAEYYGVLEVTADTFQQEVALGLYKGFEIPEEITMIKFRYYNEDGTLIEQDNIPVVYDGNSVETVETLYLVTNKATGITPTSLGWSTTRPKPTELNKYVWSYTKTTYTNRAVFNSTPYILEIFKQEGAIYIGHYSNNQAAFEANYPALFDGYYYLNTTDGYCYEFISENSEGEKNLWGQIADYSDYRYSEALNDANTLVDQAGVQSLIKAKNAWFKNIAANSGFISEFGSNVIKLSEKSDGSKGKFIAGSRFNEDGTDSGSGKGFYTDSDGNAKFSGDLVAATGTFSGELKAATGSFKGSLSAGSKFSVDTMGNMKAHNAILSGAITATQLSYVFTGKSYSKFYKYSPSVIFLGNGYSKISDSSYKAKTVSIINSFKCNFTGKLHFSALLECTKKYDVNCSMFAVQLKRNGIVADTPIYSGKLLFKTAIPDIYYTTWNSEYELDISVEENSFVFIGTVSDECIVSDKKSYLTAWALLNNPEWSVNTDNAYIIDSLENSDFTNLRDYMKVKVVETATGYDDYEFLD